MDVLRRDFLGCPRNCKPGSRLAKIFAIKARNFNELKECQLSWLMVRTKLAKKVVNQGSGKVEDASEDKGEISRLPSFLEMLAS